MTLLEPVSAMIAGAIAIPALAVLYLLKLRRRPVRVSSTLLWQQAYEDLEANIPWRLVRPSWLVLLHLLLVVLVVLAIGRPAIGDSGPAPSKLVLVLDRSASMRATDGVGGGTRFDEAKRRALRVIDDAMRLGRHVQAAVVGAAAEPVVLVPMTTDRRLLVAAIESATPTDQPLDLAAAMQLVGGMTGAGDDVASEEAPAERPPLVLLFSDGSVRSADAPAVAGVEVRLERVGPSPVRAQSDSGGAPVAGMDNAGLVTLSARRSAENPALVRVFVEVCNASLRERELPCVLFFNGVEQGRRAMAVPGAGAEGPGTASTAFELPTRSAGVVEVRLDVQDLLESDNFGWMVLGAPRSPAILLVTPAPTTDEQAAETITSSRVLEYILEELHPAAIRKITAEQAPAAVAGAAGTYDLVVFDRVSPGFVPDVPSIVLGGGLPAAGVLIQAPADASDRDFVLTWERSHPLLRDVTLDSVYTVGGALSAGPLTPGARRTDLASGASGPLLSLIELGGRKHVLAPDLEHSNWGLQVGFAIFLANAVDYLTVSPEEQSGVARRIADPIEVLVPRGVTVVRADGPAPRSVDLPAMDPSEASAQRSAALGRVDRVGLYSLPQGVVPAAVGVNLLDGQESALATADELPLRVRGSSRAGAATSVPRDISRDLLLAALVVLVIEWIVYARTARA